MNTKKFIWFGNDADGLSMVDLLTSIMCIFYIVFKIFHITLSITYMNHAAFIIQLNFIMEDVTSFMNTIILFYFAKKTIDTTVTKVGLFKSGEYSGVAPQATNYEEPTEEEIQPVEEPILEETKEDK